MNAQIKDNGLLTAPAIMTTAGDIMYASAANTPARLAKSTTSTQYLANTGTSNVPQWNEVALTTGVSGTLPVANGGTGITSLGSNVATFMGTPSSANLRAALTDETGTGAAVFATGPTFTGTVTVGVDDTGHDVKFFGAAAGAYMLWDEDANLLDVRGATAAGPGHLKLTTGELTVVASDVLGKIEFQAPAETGTDAITVAASIAAVAQDTFSATVNATDLIFYTGHSEAAAERFRFTSQNEIGIAGANYGNDGQVLTSGGAGAAAAWEDAAGGGLDSCADAIINNGYGIVIGHCAVLVAADHPANTVGEFTMIGAAGGDTGIHVIRHAADAGGGAIRFAKSRNATVGSHTVVQACDTIGEISFFGCDGGDFQPFAARIRAHVDGTPGTGDMPGRIEFSTTADGAESPTLAMNINKSQQVLHANGTAALPTVSFVCDTDVGFYRAAGNELGVSTNGTARFLFKGEEFHVGDCANGKMTVGVNICQAGSDDEIFSLKSSDVAHGMTSLSETDTMLAFTKGHACEGHIVLHAYSEGVVALHTRGYATCPQTTDTSSSKGVISFQGYKKSGTSNAQLATNENAFTVGGGAVNAVFLIKGNGDLHGADTSISSLDTHCDVGLIRAIETTKRTEGIIKSKWDDHVHENIDSLIDAGLYSVPPWEGGLLNLSQLWRLHNGAIWQLWTTIKDQGEEILGLRQQLTALEGN